MVEIEGVRYSGVSRFIWLWKALVNTAMDILVP
jgi:hypothetical protein